MLVFRGLILRHQLVMLLKNKIFFNEGDGVSGKGVSALGGKWEGCVSPGG